MPKAANALHGNQISTAQAGVAKWVVGREIRAEERSRLRGTTVINLDDRASCHSFSWVVD